MRGLTFKSPFRAVGVGLGALLLVATGCRAIVGITDTSDLPGDDPTDGAALDGAALGDASGTTHADGSPTGPVSDGGTTDGSAGGEGGSSDWARPDSVCSPDGYCWVAPLPQGNDLGGLWSSSASNVWSVGAGGTVLHYDGSAWTGTSLGQLDFAACSGDGAGHVYAVGESSKAVGVLYEWTQTSDAGAGTWAPVTSITQGLIKSFTPPPLYGVWSAAGVDDVWIVGAKGTLVNATDPVHYLTVASGVSTDLYAVAGGTNGTVYAVGAAHVVLQIAGGELTPLDAPQLDGTMVDLHGAWVAPDDTLWVVGSSGTVLTYKAGTWKQIAIDSAEVNSVFSSVTGDGTGRVWVSGLPIGPAVGPSEASGVVGAYDPGAGTWTWTTLSTVGALTAVAADPTSGHVWAAGAGGRMARWNGSAWEGSPTLTDSAFNAIAEGSAGGASDLYAVGTGGVIAHFDGTSWTLQPSAPRSLWAVWSGGGVTFAGGEETLVQLVLDGAMIEAPVPTGTVTSIWGTGPTDVYAVVENATGMPPTELVHSAGAVWEPVSVDAGAGGAVMLGVTGAAGASGTGPVLYGAVGSCLPGRGCTLGSGWLAALGGATPGGGFVAYPQAFAEAFLTGTETGETLWLAGTSHTYKYLQSGSSFGAADPFYALADGGLASSFVAIAGTSSSDVLTVANETVAYEQIASDTMSVNTGMANPAAAVFVDGARWIVGSSGSIVQGPSHP